MDNLNQPHTQPEPSRSNNALALLLTGIIVGILTILAVSFISSSKLTKQTQYSQAVIKTHPSPIINQITNWTPFYNKKFKITGKYPKEVRFEEGKPFPSETDEKLRNIEEMRFIHLNGLMLIRNNCINRSTKIAGEISILGRKASRYDLGISPPPPSYSSQHQARQGYGMNFVLENGECIDIIQFINAEKKSDTQLLFDQILSTFRFTQ